MGAMDFLWFLGLFAIVRLWNKLENQVATTVFVSRLKVEFDLLATQCCRCIRTWYYNGPVMLPTWWAVGAMYGVFGAVCRHPECAS